MSEMLPVIPFDLNFSDEITRLIKKYCSASQVEIVDEGDEDNKIYKYIGFVPHHELHYLLPKHYTLRYFRHHLVSLYECQKEYVCIFWHDNVLVVLISDTEEQHEAVMEHYEDAAALLTQIGGSLPSIIRKKPNRVINYGNNGIIYLEKYVGEASKEGDPEVPASE